MMRLGLNWFATRKSQAGRGGKQNLSIPKQFSNLCGLTGLKLKFRSISWPHGLDGNSAFSPRQAAFRRRSVTPFERAMADRNRDASLERATIPAILF
jgi:hypothetical protein